jgi:hypothetical protein
MRRTVRGGGFLNSLLAKVPYELHIPGYQYCGPNTRLEERWARGERGINPLDNACMQHDISYSKFKDTAARHKADIIFAEEADKRRTASDATWGEKAASWIVSKAMRAKVKLGAGGKLKKSTYPKIIRKIRKNKKKNRKRKGKPAARKNKKQTLHCGRGASKKARGGQLVLGKNFKESISAARKAIKLGKEKDLKSASRIALKAAKKQIKKETKLRYHPRVIPIPKRGGFIPLILPIMAALSALGSLAGGAAGIASAVNKAKQAKADFAEAQRHNTKMESVAVQGKGLFLRPYKEGLGLYLTPKN